jgi:hypothetical protein
MRMAVVRAGLSEARRAASMKDAGQAPGGTHRRVGR